MLCNFSDFRIMSQSCKKLIRPDGETFRKSREVLYVQEERQYIGRCSRATDAASLRARLQLMNRTRLPQSFVHHFPRVDKNICASREPLPV